MGDVPRVEALLREFTSRFEAGEDVRPDDLLAQVSGVERAELAALLDAYLERAPRRRFAPDALAASPARAVVDELARSLGGAAGTWPVVLPRLRARARLRRAELVTRLAEGLGFPGREADVARWYHGMEHGTLDPVGVSDRVLDVLAGLVGTTRDALRAAGRGASAASDTGAGGGGAVGGGPVFARRALPDPAFVDEPDSAAAAPPPSAPGPAPALGRDDPLAHLFTGGQDAGGADD